jgi:amidohydrolase
MSTKNQIKILCSSFESKLIRYRRYLHQHPELSFHETNTSAWIRQHLQECGIELQDGFHGNSVVGKLQGKLPGPRIAFRADIDALPIQEENDLPYRSVNPGVMHACGHDSNTAVLICLAELLAARKQTLCGTAFFVFQQGEEKKPGGAQQLIQDGLMRHVDEIYGMHLAHTIDTGQIVCAPGPQMASSDSFEIKLCGNGGHAAFPHQSADPILAGAALVQAVHTIIPKFCPASDTVVINVTQAHSSEGPVNVIPSSFTLAGTVRTHKDELREAIAKHIGLMAQNIGSIYKCQVHTAYEMGYPVLINSAEQTETAQNAISKMGYEVLLRPATMGSEDFARYLQNKPGCYMKLGMKSDRPGCYGIPHTATFRFDENAMLIGLECFTAIALERLEER